MGISTFRLRNASVCKTDPRSRQHAQDPDTEAREEPSFGDILEEEATAVSEERIDLYPKSDCMMLDESPYSESLSAGRIVPFRAQPKEFGLLR